MGYAIGCREYVLLFIPLSYCSRKYLIHVSYLSLPNSILYAYMVHTMFIHSSYIPHTRFILYPYLTHTTFILTSYFSLRRGGLKGTLLGGFCTEKGLHARSYFCIGFTDLILIPEIALHLTFNS